MAKRYRCLLHTHLYTHIHIMSERRRIGIIEGAAHRLDIDYGRDVTKLIRSIVMPKSAQDQILSVVDQHYQGCNQHRVIQVRDVNFTDQVDVHYAAKRIRRHKLEDHWEPVGLMELLCYVKKVPGVYLGRMVYALGHIYTDHGQPHILSVTDNRGAIDFELMALRPDQRFSHLAVFPEFRVIS